MMNKRFWKILKNTNKATKERILGFMLLGAVLLANLSPIFGQTPLDSPVLNTPAGNAVCGFGTREQSTLLSGGECNNGFLTGICGSIIEPANVVLSGNTGYDISCAKDALAKGDASKLIAILNSSGGGVVGGVGTAVAMLIQQRPLSGIDYIENQVYALTNPGQVSAQEPPAYYRGTGFDLLRPMQAFWGWSVNIVYALMILIVIFVAFGIIFKTSLNGGVVVALQSAIPNIVLAMILVPLSYAITGLFVDGITVGVNVVHQFLIGNGSPGNDVYQNRNTEFPLGNLIVTGGSSDPVADGWDRGLYADDIRLNWIYVSANLGFTERLRPGIIAVAGILGVDEAVASSNVNSFFGDILVTIINLVIAVILLWTGVRIFWLLINKFLAFLIGPLFAPFIFATVALPSGGTKMIFSYLKSIAAASLYYIVAYAMFLLSMILASDYILVQTASVGTPLFTPPLTGAENFINTFEPGSSGQTIPSGVIGLYLTIASLFIYMLIPSTLKKIDGMLGVNEGGIMSIFNDVKKSVTDSVGMAKMWRDNTKKYAYNGVVGGVGRVGNRVSKTFTGRTLNGPDGWGTNQYKRVAGAARQRIGRMKNSSNVFMKAAGYAAGVTAGASLNLAEDTIGGAGSSTKTSGKDGKGAKITAEFGGGNEYFPMQKGNIMVTKEGIFKIFAHYGYIIDDTGRPKLVNTPQLAEFSQKYKLSFKIEGSSFGSIVTPQAFNFRVPRDRHDNNGPISMGGYNVAQVFKSGLSLGGGSQPALLMNPDRGGQIFDFVNEGGGFFPKEYPVHFVIDPGANPKPVFQTANKQTFDIVFQLKFNFSVLKELENFFGKWQKSMGMFVGGTFDNSKITSKEYIFKISDIVVNGDISQADSLQVRLLKK